MRLTLKRGQKKEGMISKSVVFVLDARAQYTEEEKHAIREYGLGNQVIYNSEASKKHLEAAETSSGWGALARTAMHRLSLNVTVDSLGNGHSIDCKTLDEVMGAEEAIRQACETVKQYITLAQTFNGDAEVVEY